ncbi:MAG: hypothetical protein SOU48_00195 [Prevotella sp.]|nr:hypothetical protein [Prevotella sp.]
MRFASRGTNNDSIIKVSDAVMVRPRGKGTTEGWQKHTKSTNNNVSATERKQQPRGKT